VEATNVSQMSRLAVAGVVLAVAVALLTRTPLPVSCSAVPTPRATVTTTPVLTRAPSVTPTATTLEHTASARGNLRIVLGDCYGLHQRAIVPVRLCRAEGCVDTLAEYREDSLWLGQLLPGRWDVAPDLPELWPQSVEIEAGMITVVDWWRCDG
jgi:hypothetical protein